MTGSRATRAYAESELVALEREFERHLTAGLHDALRFLNARTRYRFTGAYRFDPPMLRPLALYDRENPTVRLSAQINPLRETYCSIVRATSTAFVMHDAPNDEQYIPPSPVVSYCGVPLETPDGVVVGTLCHFDLRPRTIPAAELSVLERAARVISRACRGALGGR